MTRTPFPLQWPEGWSRTPVRDRGVSRFVTGMQMGLKGLRAELERLGAVNIVITSDLPTRSNGMPYGEAADSGIAVWFVLDGKERVMACDRWGRASENIHAIALSIEALRGLSRWGANDIVVKAFEGFKALPAPPGLHTQPPTRNWREVLGAPVGAGLAEIRRLHRLAMRKAHPDHGGSHEQAIEVSLAMSAAERELGVQA